MPVSSQLDSTRRVGGDDHLVGAGHPQLVLDRAEGDVRVADDAARASGSSHAAHSRASDRRARASRSSESMSDAM